MSKRLHVLARHREQLETLFREHLPEVEVWAYGSRVDGRSHAGSDLDLVLRGPGLGEVDLTRLADFQQALNDSTIPFVVEARDWARLPERFHREIEREYEVFRLAWNGVDVEEASAKAGTGMHQSERGAWRECQLGDVIELKRGYDLPKQRRRLGAVPVVSSSGITDCHSKSKVRGPGVVTGRYGTLGRVYFVREAFWPLNTTLYVRDFRGNDPRFISYLLESLDFSAYSDKAAVPGLNRNHLHLDVVRLPETVAEQRAIAHILGRLDDKIELNRRMNETLGAMARTLFKSWFVDFDPVRAKMEGRGTGLTEDIANLFPDRLIDSEMGEIPEGWGVVPLDAVARFQNGLALQKFRPAPNEERLPVVKIAQLRAGEASSGEWASSSIKPGCIIEDGDVLFSWSGSLLARIWCGGRAALNQHLFKVTSEEYPKWFYLQSLLSHLAEFRRIAQDKATTMGHIRRHHLTEALCPAPPDGVIERLSGTFSSLLERQVANEMNSRTHNALRDALLPKIISGEIRIPDAERALEAPA